MKTCSKCKAAKPLSDFGKCASASDGLAWWCKSCFRLKAKEWRMHNPEAARAKDRAQRIKHKEKLLQRGRARYAADAERWRAYAKAYRAANPDQAKQRDKRQRDKTKERRSQLRKEYYANNKHRERAVASVWRASNRERVARQRKAWATANGTRTKQQRAAWRENNRASCRERDARRRATQLQATPAWADHEAIRRVYEVAEVLGLTVDHIVPLQSKLVCGLHCEANLQVLSKSENSAKKNYFWPDMP